MCFNGALIIVAFKDQNDFDQFFDQQSPKAQPDTCQRHTSVTLRRHCTAISANFIIR